MNFRNGALDPPAPSPPGNAVRRLPPLTTALFLLNAAFFVAEALSGGSEEPAVVALFGGKVTSLIEEGELWRLLSSAYLHIGPLHFMLNAYALYLLGGFIERAYGWRRALVIYTFGALAGSAASTLASPILSAGASGAIFGLLGVTLLFGFQNRARLPPRARWMLWAWLLPFFIASIGLSFLWKMIDNWAHLGGLAGGVLVALCFGNPLGPRARSRPREWAATATAALAAATTLVSLGFAARSAAGEALWASAPVRSLVDEAHDVRIEIPRAWEMLPTPARNEMAYVDRLGAAMALQVFPAVSGAADLGAQLQSELRSTVLTNPKAGLLAGPEPFTLASGLDAIRVVVEVRDEPVRYRRQWYFAPGRGRSAVLLFEYPASVADLYHDVFTKIARSLTFADGSPLVDAWVAIERGELREAIPFLERVPKGPQRPLALRALARTYQALREPERALAAAREAVELAPDSLRSHTAHIEALHRAGRVPEAGQAVDAARRRFAKDVRALAVLADLAATVGLGREAARLYEEVLSASRDYSVFNNYAWLLATSEERGVRDPEKAVRMARAAVEGHQWKNATFIDTLAEAQLAAGRPREAVAIAEKALALEKDSDYLRKQLGKFRRAAGLSAGEGFSPRSP
jgi:rhomboid protease GluP